MSEILNALDAVERVNNLFRPLQDAEQKLRDLGGLEATATNLNRQIVALKDKRTAMEGNLQEAEARIASAPGIVSEARAEADEILGSAHQEAIKLVNMAKSNAEAVLTEHSRQVEALKSEIGVLRSARAQAENDLIDMREQVAAEQRKLDETRHAVEKVKADAIAALG